MTTRHLVDPELLAGLDIFPLSAFSAETLPAIRTQIVARAADRPAPVTAGVAVERRLLPSPGGHDVPVLIHRPHGLPADAPAILYLHGGGYVIGSAEMMLPSTQGMAAAATALLVSVDYRLAPETPHPGPVEDAYVALAWLHANAASLGVDPRRIALVGESAGGGLAAALALLARDRAEVAPVHQHLIYPMLDDRTDRASANPHAGEFIWTPESNVFGWSALLGYPAGGADVPPYAAPARAADLAGLPPAFIAVGALDLFAEEDIDYARRLMRAGVPTELHVYPGAYHGFGLAAEAAVTLRANDDSMTALRRALHRPVADRA